MNKLWRSRFIGLAEHIATFSKDPSTQCGAVIVRPDKTIASVGFNGFPKNVNDNPDLYNDRPTKYLRILHAETNAILNARERLDDYSIFVWPFGTCASCAAQIIQSGISRVFYPAVSDTDRDARWNDSLKAALAMYVEAGIYCFEVEEETDDQSSS